MSQNQDILEQIDTNNDNQFSVEEIEKALESWWVLEDLDSDTNKQQEFVDLLKKNSNLANVFKEAISRYYNQLKNKQNLTSDEQNLINFYEKYFLQDSIETLSASSTYEYIKNTDLNKKLNNYVSKDSEINSVETLVNKMDSTWKDFIESYFSDDNILENMWINIDSLVVGVNFAFMDWYNKNKIEETPQTTTSSNDYLSSFTNLLSWKNWIWKLLSWFTKKWQNLDIFGWLLSWISNYMTGLPLDAFFKKIQNSINFIKEYWNQKNIKNIVNNPKTFISFFEIVPEANFLQPKDIKALYQQISDTQFQSADLTAIANLNATKFDQDAYDMLKQVINQWPSVLSLKKYSRSALVEFYDSFSGLLDQFSELGKMFGFDIPNTKEALKSLWSVWDIAFAILWYNWVDWFIQDYWLEKLNNLPDWYQGVIDNVVSNYQNNLKKLDSSWSVTTDDSQIDWVKTLNQNWNGNQSILSAIGLLFTSQKDPDNNDVFLINWNQIANPALFAIDYDSLKTNIQDNLSTLSGLNFDENNLQKVIKTLITDPKFLNQINSRTDLNSNDLIAMITWSYILYEQNKKSWKVLSKNNFEDFAFWYIQWAFYYNYEKSSNKSYTETFDNSNIDVDVKFESLEVNQQNYINHLIDNKVFDTFSTVNPGKTEDDFKKIAAKIFTEASKYPETKNIVPYIFAQIEQESWWKIDAHNTKWENSYWLMQINTVKNAHPDYTWGTDVNANLEYWIRYLAQCIKQRWNVKDGFDAYNWAKNFQKDIADRYSTQVFKKLKARYLPEYIGSKTLDNLKGQDLSNMALLWNKHVGLLWAWWLFQETYAKQWESSEEGDLWKDGWKIDDLYDWNVLKQWVIDYLKKTNIKSVLLFFGGNEATSWIFWSAYKAKLKKLIDDIEALNPNIKPILICSPLKSDNSYYNKRKQNNQETRDLANDNGYALLDFENVITNDSLRKKDNTYLKPNGYKKLVSMIKTVFELA